MEWWKDIRDSPGYEVSNLGNVRNKKSGRVLKPRLNKKNGYGRVNVGGRDRFVHRLVMETFFECDREDTDVIHINGVRSDNSLANLKWVPKLGAKTGQL